MPPAVIQNGLDQLNTILPGFDIQLVTFNLIISNSSYTNAKK